MKTESDSPLDEQTIVQIEENMRRYHELGITEPDDYSDTVYAESLVAAHMDMVWLLDYIDGLQERIDEMAKDILSSQY